MKTTLLRLLSVMMFSCSQEKIDRDENFYRPLPFEGMKGDIESVSILRYFEHDTDTTNPEIKPSSRTTAFYNPKGKRDSTYHIEYKGDDSITSLIRFYYEGEDVTKTIEERRGYDRERIIETIFQRDDKENYTILKRDLSDSTIDIPNGSIKIDFAKQSTTVKNARDIEVGVDVVETVTNFYKDRKTIRYESQAAGGEPSMGYMKYNENGLLDKTTFVNKKYFFFSTKIEATFQYLNFDEKGNYTEARMLYNGDDINFTLVEKLKFKYKE